MHRPGWRHSCLVALSLAACIAVAGAADAVPKPVHNVHSAKLDALYAQILKNPQDDDLNLRFARAAEKAGVLRWALSAYERVTINDPGNLEAQAGLQRIRRKLQPDISQVTLELGSALETNPRYYLGPKRTEIEGLAAAILYDERAIADMRWRTTGSVAGKIYSKSHDLDFASAALDTGPVLDVFPGWSVVPAIGGAATYYDHHFYYGEGAVSATFEGPTQGAVRALQLRAAYRSYDQFFPAGNGYYLQARGRYAVPNLLGAGSVVIASPWLLYSDISGTVISPIAEIQPGAYLEAGGKLEAYKRVTSWLTVGAEFSALQRRYRTDTVPATGGKRHDTLLIPGASLLFPHLFSYQSDLRISYQYIRDNSNDSTKDFDDHVVTAKLIYRFDPFSASVASASGLR
jgi:opacity protein-like surface antigen